MAGDGRFKPGNKAAVGRVSAALPPQIRAERKRNQAALIRLVAKHFMMTDDQAQERMAGPDITRAEMAVFRMIEKATKDGDVSAFKMMIEIMCGKIPESDYDQYTEEDIKALNRAKEILEEEKAKANTFEVDGSSAKASNPRALGPGSKV